MKLLFLSVTAGQGHNQAAKGIMQRMIERGHSCKLIDTLDYIEPMLGEAVDKGFRALIANIPLAKPMSNDRVLCGQKSVLAVLNKGKPEELEEAVRIEKIYRETGDKNLAANCDGKNMAATTIVAKACRIVALMNVAVGDAVFIGLPGEPFTEIGRAIKAGSPYTVTLPTCNTNDKAGYFPTEYFEGSYEAATTRYAKDTAQQLIDTSLALLKDLR